MMKKYLFSICLVGHLLFTNEARAQESPKEEDFYKIVTLPVPEGILLEVGGVTSLRMVLLL